MRNKGSASEVSVIDAPMFRRIIRRFYALLQANEQLLNDLNVFPVPDGDTGTNSVLTIQSGLGVLEKGRSDLSVVSNALAREVGMGARGNSGVILAEYLHGFASRSEPTMSAHQWHEALVTAATMAGESVSVPRDGTMLSIARAAAEQIPGTDFAQYVSAIALAVREAVTRTTEQLPELTAAGVVDSGALALSYLHEAVANELAGLEIPDIELAQRTCDVTAIEYRGPSHEVMFLFDGDADSLRDELGVIGESVTITGRANPFNVHVHVDHPGEALSEAMRHGRAYRISITQLIGTSDVAANGELSGIGVVMAGEGRGLGRIVEAAGATFIPKPPMSALSTIDFVRAIRKTNCAHVIVLPSYLDCHASVALAAHQVRAEGITVHMIGTSNVPSSLASLAVCDATSDVAHALDAMTKAAQTTREGAVKVSTRSSMTAAGLYHEGDIIGLISNVPVEISTTASVHDMAAHVVDKMLDHGGDLVTVLVGKGGDDLIGDRLAAEYPGIEFNVLRADQTTHTYLIGVE